MKRSALIIGLVLSILGVLLFTMSKHWSRVRRLQPTAASETPSENTSVTPNFQTNQLPDSSPQKRLDRKQAVELVQSIYSAPIAFYGRTQDEHGNPIPNANIEFSVLDKFWNPGTKYGATSDDNGLFSLTGANGAAVSVAVWKQGYAGITGKSNGAFSYGMPFDAQRDRPTPTKEHPAIFVLRKKAEADPLFVVRRDISIPKDGSPVDVNLRTGKPVAIGQGDIRIECWTADNVRDASGHYEWKARIIAPGGGLAQQRSTELEVTAPETGYESMIEVAMPQASPDWRCDHDAHYWVRLRDQTYARMRLRITTAGDHFVSISSYLNPSGSRNLEFDENRVIK